MDFNMTQCSAPPHRWWLTYSMISFLFLAIVAPSQGEELYADPRYPDELNDSAQHASASRVLFYKIPVAIKEASARVDSLQGALDALPDLQSPMLPDHFGYHSDYLPVTDEQLPEKPRWTLDFKLHVDGGPLDFVLIPAQDHRISTPSGYAFPKRFRIVSQQLGKMTVFVDWTKADFPDPGLRPVYFHLPDYKLMNVRLEVFAGHENNGVEFFALGRVGMIRRNEVRQFKYVQASSSFESKPYWSSAYLKDKRFTVGLPLKDGGSSSSSSDFVLPLEKKFFKQPLVIEIDLGEIQKIGWISFFPGKSPDSISVPGYGFPGTIGIEVLDQHGSSRPRAQNLIRKSADIENPGNNLVRFPGRALTGRYLRIYMNNFPSYQGQPVLSLGEINVTYINMSLGFKQPITIHLNGNTLETDASPLVDGTAGGNDLIPLTDYLRHLAAAKPIEKQLNLARTQQNALTERWSVLSRRAYILGAVLLMITIISVGLVSFKNRHKQNFLLRKQISSDLHDDIGSKVAAIGLASTYIKQTASESPVRQRGERIQAIALSMHQGLRDVLWLTDNQTDTLEELMQKLADTARKTISSERLTLEVSPRRTLPKRNIGMQIKREILMFLKEAIHNATVHSNATAINVTLTWENKSLNLSIRDNGDGFEVPEDFNALITSSHHGLYNMNQRAEKLKAAFQLLSQPQAGTTVSLRIPSSGLHP